MMAGSHVALGAAAWLAAAPRLGLPALEAVPLGLAVLGSLLPDIDHPKSWVGKRVKPVSNIIGAVFGHRGVTHSLLAVVACAVLLARDGLPHALIAPLVVGYLSHLAADLLTPGGLRLAWPLRGTYALPLCRTGSAFEPLVVALILAWVGCGTFGTPDPRAAWDSVRRTEGLCRLWQGCATEARKAPEPARRVAEQPPRRVAATREPQPPPPARRREGAG